VDDGGKGGDVEPCCVARNSRREPYSPPGRAELLLKRQ
jgi:hypothetical protein